MNSFFTYIANLIPNPDEALVALQTELNWVRTEAPRSEYYCNDFPVPYTYGSGKGKRTYHPQPPNQTIKAVRATLKQYTNTKFEVCFLNRYLNQHDSLYWHADDELEMDDARPIATVSFGVEREIWFRDNLTKEITKIKLGHGSLCLMHAGMQETHMHRIPKASFNCGERISLTFRGYLPQ